MKYLNIHSYQGNTHAEGPGNRFALWVQGCMKRCKDCCNPDMLEVKPSRIVRNKSIIQLIEKSVKKFNIEGITLLGGEPFLQAKGLLDIAEYCSRNHLSVMIFSGYSYTTLLEGTIEGAKELLSFTDLLVDGVYRNDLPDLDRNWVGSTNQKFHFLSNFYMKGIEFDHVKPGLDLLISKNSITFNGYPVRIRG
jgi:anaerobic ribonucleoside-triphosphate reductase activating protein